MVPTNSRNAASPPLPELLLPGDLAPGGAQQLIVGPVRVRPVRDSTLGSHQRFTQGAVVGNHPLPASPTPWWRGKCGAESSQHSGPISFRGEGGAGVAGDGKGSGPHQQATPSSPSLRSGGPPQGGHNPEEQWLERSSLRRSSDVRLPSRNAPRSSLVGSVSDCCLLRRR